MNLKNSDKNVLLMKHRMERIEYCDKHVEKRVNATKQINLKRKKIEDTNGKYSIRLLKKNTRYILI